MGDGGGGGSGASGESGGILLRFRFGLEKTLLGFFLFLRSSEEEGETGEDKEEIV